ncbi:MAG TPA: glycosyltransferase [Azospirillaceae bacterium]|nr:glycosyltransferase [Azospirillaceae bacterium]
MKLLYVGDLTPGGTGLQRLQALERIGFEVRGMDTAPCATAGGWAAVRLRARLQLGPVVAGLNRDLLAQAAAFDPGLVWFDKPTFVYPETIRRLRHAGRTTVNYVIDNPFHLLPRETGMRLIRRSIPEFAVNIVPRPSGLEDYRARGAGTVVLMPLAFDPWTHYPPPAGLEPSVPLAYIGSPYGGRPSFVAGLAARGLPVSVRGALWRERHAGLAGGGLRLAGPVYGDAYREAIWSAGACLAFITHAHRDVTAHKSFEIAGCGTLLLAERSDAHRAAFEEGSEALFFDGVEEAAAHAGWLARNPAARAAIARAGCRRAWRSGYANEERLAAAIAEFLPERGSALRTAAARAVAARRAAVGLD